MKKLSDVQLKVLKALGRGRWLEKDLDNKVTITNRKKDRVLYRTFNSLYQGGLIEVVIGKIPHHSYFGISYQGEILLKANRKGGMK